MDKLGCSLIKKFPLEMRNRAFDIAGDNIRVVRIFNKNPVVFGQSLKQLLQFMFVPTHIDEEPYWEEICKKYE
jgi:hypothetical protein